MSTTENLPAGPAATAPVAPASATASTAASVEFAESMPYLLLSMLERRYLGDLQPSRWALEAPGDDGARPLLREISALPRTAPAEDSGLAMPHILSASH